MSDVSDLREKVDQQLEAVKTNMQSMLGHVIELTTVNERMHVSLPLQITISEALERIIFKDCPPISGFKLLQGYNSLQTMRCPVAWQSRCPSKELS